MEIISNIFKVLFEIIESIFKFIFEATEGIFLNDNKEYKAEFATSGILLSRFNQGFCLTGNKCLTRKASYQNALVVGGTGVGKSTVVLIPSIFKTKGSYIVHDCSKELGLKTSGYEKQIGKSVKYLNYAEPSKSCGYNPIKRVKTSSDVNKLANLLVSAKLGENNKDPFWIISGTNLIAMLIHIVLKLEPQYQNLYTVLQLLNRLGGDPQSVDALFSEYADDTLFTEYKSFISTDEKIRSSIIATAKAALQLFSDPDVAKVTSYDNIDFQEFRDKPTVLYIQNSVADQKYYSVLTSIFFEQFFSYLLGRFPKDIEQDIFLLIDEASSLNLPTLPLAVANVRKHRSGIMLLVQDFNQLIHQYGTFQSTGIKSNCFAKMYFTGQSLETATELERTLGKFEYKDKKGNKVIRSLMTSDEIRMMDIKRALLICGHHPPIKAKLRPYYKNSRFNGYSKIPAYDYKNNVTEEIAVLPLNILRTDE